MRIVKWIGVAMGALALAGPARAEEATDRYAAGARAVEEGDLAKAITELRAAVEAKPNAKALLMLGNTYMKVGQLDEAKAALEQVLVLDPTSKKRPQVERMIRDLGALGRTRLQITSTPPGAIVYVDLKAEGQRGRTPLVLPVPPGRHRVMLELAGHEAAAREGVIAVEGVDVPLAFDLLMLGCDITLSAQPEGALVRIDDGARQGTPTRTRIRPGDHQIEFSGKGLLARRRAVKCEGQRLEEMKETLAAVATGELSIRAAEGARITVDGKPVAQGEALRLVVTGGEHAVAVVDGQGGAWRATATVRAGELTAIVPELLRVAPTAAPAAPQPAEVAIYRRGWLWAGVAAGVAVGAGLGIGLAVGLTPRDAALPESTAGSAVLSFR